MKPRHAGRQQLEALWAKLVDAVHWSRVLILATLCAPLLGSGALLLLPPLLGMAVRDRKRRDLWLPLVFLHGVPALGMASAQLLGGSAELLNAAGALLAGGVLAAAVLAILALGMPQGRRLPGLAMACLSFGPVWWPGLRGLYIDGHWAPTASWWGVFPALIAATLFFESSRHFRLQELAQRLQLSEGAKGWRRERLLLDPSGRLRYALPFHTPISGLFIAKRPPALDTPDVAYSELDTALELSLPAALEPLRTHSAHLNAVTLGAGAFGSSSGLIVERRVDPDAQLDLQYEAALDLLARGEALRPLYEQICRLTGQPAALGEAQAAKTLQVDLDPQASFAKAMDLHPDGKRQWRDLQGGGANGQ